MFRKERRGRDARLARERVPGRRVGSRFVELHVPVEVIPPAIRCSPIAANAAGYDVFPIFSAALGDRHNMVESQFRRGEHLAAVLARVIVPGVNVGAREGDVVYRPLDANVAEQPPSASARL